MEGFRFRNDPVPCVYDFSPSEIMKMESLFEEVGEKSPSQDFCQKLATSFSCSLSRTGKPSIKWEQVQSWFENKREALIALVPYETVDSTELLILQDPSISSNAFEDPQLSEDISELLFEAKSAKDYAWYDVGSFQNYRVLSTGELEVRVRFAGFRNVEDEWVNVKRGVRERSIPLEPSECQRVKVGDLVLCYRECSEHAIYCDAHIVEIQQRLHDITGCRCIFVVRYDYDNVEEKVSLKDLCCRPASY